HGSGGRLELRLEDERPGPVATRGRFGCADRRESPLTVRLVAEDGREARRGIEAGQTQPLHGAVPTDERRRLKVTDEAVVLDWHVARLRVCVPPAHHPNEVTREGTAPPIA